MSNQEKIKVLLNAVDVINAESWTQMFSASTAEKLKQWKLLIVR